MSLVLVVLLVAGALGLASGGSPGRLGTLPLRRRRLVVAALGVQLAGGLVGGVAYPAGLALSALLAVAFLVANRGVRGTGLIGAGVVLNALVVGVNGAMPVEPGAAARAGVTLQAVLAGEDPRHELAGHGTRLRLLGDGVPVPLPVLPQVVSPGDVLVAAGLGQLVLLGMRRRPAAPHRDGSTPAGRAAATVARAGPPRRRAVVDAGRDWLRDGVRVE